ncbi:hypothetical protein [Niveibacterium sp. SC-1]|uniref:hypothetical protein n=1 Tax=Niveibacterium sp. SC-1 TaxID=3135646 RepID=UPI00311FA183
MNTRIVRAVLVAILGVAATASFASSTLPHQGEAAWAPRGEYAGTVSARPVVTALRQTPLPSGYQAAVAYQPRGEYAKQGAAAALSIVIAAEPAIPHFSTPYQGEAAWIPRDRS